MSTIRKQVMEFHRACETKDPEKPTIPSDAKVRLRARLITEEYIESMKYMFDDEVVFAGCKNVIDHAYSQLKLAIDNAPVQVDMVSLMDGLADIDVVVEGTRLSFGVNGEPIAAEVHRSNMAKFKYGIKRREDGKILKPSDWTPPEIKGELEKQGWKE
jgi:predicted HAD superfamily Cof-like phosphohydrolase